MMSPRLIPHAELDAPPLRDGRIAQCHLALHLDGAAHRIDDAGELDEQAIARNLDDATAMFLDFGVGQLAPECLERGERAFLVLAHQPRIARDIGRQDRRQPAFDPFSPLALHDGDHSVRIALATAKPGPLTRFSGSETVIL